MFKNIIKISAFTAVVLFSGCGGSSSNTTEDKGTSKVPSELMAMVTMKYLNQTIYDVTDFQEIETLMDTVDFTETAITTKDCPNGGTIIVDINNTQKSFTIKELFQDCAAGRVEQDGEVLTTISDGNSTMINTTDFNITGTTYSYITKQGSKTTSIYVEDGNKTSYTENREVLYNSQSYKSVNLKYIEDDLDDNKTSSYYISGKEIFNGKTFIVDSGYDSSITPFISDKDDNLISGKTLYTNDQNHSIVVEVISENRLKLSIDEDRDGTIDKEEITSPSIF